MKNETVPSFFHLKLQHYSNRPHNSAISPSLLHGNVISASSTLFSRYYAVWNFAKLPSFPPDPWMHVHHVLPSLLFYSLNLCFWSERKLVTEIWVQIIRLHCNAMACSFVEFEGGNKYDTEKLQKLGWTYRPMEETLRDSIECHRRLGILNWASIQLGHLCQVWLLVLVNCLCEHVKGEAK